MPRYIDADKLLARYKARCAGCKETKNYCEHCCDLADVISDIEDAPTIEERKKGEWSEFVPGLYKCSECGKFSPTKEDFCPNCGADMREEQADDKSGAV